MSADACIVCFRDLRDEVQTCINCLNRARNNLSAIMELAALGEERLDGWPAISAGTPKDGAQIHERPLPGGDLLVMLSDGSEGRSEPDALFQQDPDSLTFMLGSWEDDWRQIRGEGAAPHKATITNTVAYLNERLGWAAQHHPAFDEFAGQLSKAVSALESGLRTGDRVERGVPCRECGERLIRRALPKRDCAHSRQARLMASEHQDETDVLRQILLAYPEAAEEHSRCDQGGYSDNYECRTCGQTYTQAEYWLAVRAQIEEVS